MEIAKPIVVLKKDEMIQSQINQNSFPMEYSFSICNYNENDVNEVDFEYTIEIENSNEKFPVKYQLFDCDNQKQISFDNGISEKMKIDKFEKQDRNFNLIMEWKELEIDLASDLELKLKINIVQSEE